MARVRVDTSMRHQTLLGFGATIYKGAYQLAQHPKRDAINTALFSESGIDILRLRNHYGYTGEEDLSNDLGVVSTAAQYMGRKPTIFLSSWSPPAALKANGASECQGSPDTCTLAKMADGSFDYAGFANHWRDSLEAYASVGITADYIGIQNDPDWVPTDVRREACRFLPTEGTAKISLADGGNVEIQYPGFAQALEAVVQRLSGVASPPKIAAPEASQLGTVADYVRSLDPAHVDAIAHHTYGTNPEAVDAGAFAALGQLGQEYQRPLLQTEMKSDGFGTAILMHYTLAVEGASAYLQNDFVDSVSGGDPMAFVSLTADDFTLELPFHAMSHYAARTDPGWVRVDAISEADTLLASAWLSPQGDALTIVLVNTGSTVLDAAIDPADEGWTTSEVRRTAFQGIERSARLGVDGGRSVRVPGHGMVTVALRR
jgi:glucuronoarabinoxylan endo-1,4-beta-xylanase